MLATLRIRLCGLVLSLLIVGCSSDAKTAKEYDIVGKVTAIADDKSTVSLDHDAIPGLMQAMEMKFRLANADIVKDIQTGDAVKGRLRVQDGYTILSLSKNNSSPADKKAAKIKAALDKLDPKDRALAEAQKWCPIQERSLLGSMGVPSKLMINGQPVFTCCDGCDDDAKADPAKTLAKVEELKKKAK